MNASVLVARKALHLTQEALVAAVDDPDFNRGDAIRMEQGWVPPKSIRKKVAKALKKSEADLFAEVLAA